MKYEASEPDTFHDPRLPMRFWRKVERSTTGCWLWTGATNEKGYGRFNYDHKLCYPHRLIWEITVGPIGEGLQIDHLCRVRNCVNPAHLEPVTPRVNTFRSLKSMATVNAAKTRCVNGHEFTLENTAYRPDGARACRACARIWAQKYRDERAALAAALSERAS